MLLVYGPRCTSYDFGPGHPLTPRRFGPGIGLLRAVGAEPGLAPEPAPDDELLWCHTPRYLEVVKRFSRDPYGPPAAGIGEGGDDPPFAGMHEAGAMVAGGSLRAVEAILRGDVDHAFHPGGGLHHAMPDRASGFCIYDDPALAIARARRDGLRVLYVDLDVHHGDGVQAIHWDDPGVLTLSFHESGRYLFPGTGGVGEVGEGIAAGTAVNVPLEPDTGEGPWLDAVRTLLLEVAAAFGPDLVVSQHGADSHAWDPLAHLRVTTTAMGEAARLVDAVAHRFAGGRWLATGGGGYDAYRVVPRVWSLVWLAGAHREVPDSTPVVWRAAWAEEAARYGQAPLPETFTDRPNAGEPIDLDQEVAESRSAATTALVRRHVVPRLLREARDRGWWDPLAAASAPGSVAGSRGLDAGEPVILDALDPAAWSRLGLAAGVLPPLDPAVAHALVAAGLGDGLRLTAAVAGATVVGAVVTGPAAGAASVAADAASARTAAATAAGAASAAAAAAAAAAGRSAVEATAAGTDLPTGTHLLAIGVAPAWRRRGLAGRLLATHLGGIGADAGRLDVEITVAERDAVDPLDRALRTVVARRLFERAGFRIGSSDADLRAADPGAVTASYDPRVAP